MQNKKDTLLTLHDIDIFPNPISTNGVVWKDRPTGKVVLFNEKNEIALMGNKVSEFFLLPGGGIEGTESVLEGVKRECQEETGCDIEMMEELGVTEDYRARECRHCISYGYTAKVISYGNSALTENEKDIGAYTKWIPLEMAISMFLKQEDKVKSGDVKFYNTCFNIYRDSLFVQLAKKLKIN